MTTTIEYLCKELLLKTPAGALFDAVALPAASATKRSEVVLISGQLPPTGRLAVRLLYTGGASGTTGRAEVRVWTSAKDGAPADYTDPSWGLISENDGVITAAQNYAGAAPAVNGNVLMQPIKLTTPAAAAGVVMAPVFSLKLPPCRYIYVEACEIGDPTHMGTLQIGLAVG